MTKRKSVIKKVDGVNALVILFAKLFSEAQHPIGSSRVDKDLNTMDEKLVFGRTGDLRS